MYSGNLSKDTLTVNGYPPRVGDEIRVSIDSDIHREYLTGTHSVCKISSKSITIDFYGHARSFILAQRV